MTTDVTLYIGPATAYRKFRFDEQSVWDGVRSQITAAMEAGKGLITIPWKGTSIVFVYSPYLMVTWVEKEAE